MRSVKVANLCPSISHLFFADDNLVFSGHPRQIAFRSISAFSNMKDFQATEGCHFLVEEEGKATGITLDNVE